MKSNIAENERIFGFGKGTRKSRNVEGMHKDNDYYYSLSICLRVEIIRILKLTTQEVP